MRPAWLLLLVVVLTTVARPPGSHAKDVFDWLDWIKGKITGQDDPQPPNQPVAQEKGLKCLENRSGGETCTITAGRNAPEASALHRLLRYPSQEQLAVRAAGQLHVVITGGAYTSLPLMIPNNTRITVEEGASLVFDAAGADFYQLWVAEPLPTYSRGQDVGSTLRYRAHLDCDGCRCIFGFAIAECICVEPRPWQHLQYCANLDCDGCRDVTIDGGGTIVGGGDRWWAMWAAKQHGDSDASDFLSRDRPPILEFRSCSNVAISGLRFTNSPWWGLHPFNCSGLSMTDLIVESPEDREGADGIVLDSNTDVRIQRAGITTGGDCVALQAGLGKPGRQRKLPTRSVLMLDVACEAPHGAALRIGPQLVGGIQDVMAAGWSVQHTKDAALLETAWGCGGSVQDVLLSGWSVDNVTSDVLRVHAKSSGCESGWARTHTGNITLHGFALAPGAKQPHIRVQGSAPLALSGFHADSALRSGAACWSPVWVGSICRAAPACVMFLWLLAALAAVRGDGSAFVMFLWLLAALAAFVVVSVLVAVASWKAWQRYKKWRELRAIETADLDEEHENSLDMETLELVNLEHRRALSAPIEDSLEEPSIRPLSAASQAAARQSHRPSSTGNGTVPQYSLPPAWAKASFETSGSPKP